MLAGVLVFGLTRSVWAFSLGGPIANGGDSWQNPIIGYGLPEDLNAPKNIGEGYRYNTPTVYYAYDANFVDFFSTNGEAAIQSVFAILDNTFTNANYPATITSGLDGYSAGLSEFPLNSKQFNFQAQALGMYDLKSAALGAMMEQLGLADPIRYDWTIHDRFQVPGTTCPFGTEYLIVQRNFDTGGYPIVGSSQVNSIYSPYVNGSLYSWVLSQACTGPNPLALSIPVIVDPTPEADRYTPLASSAGGFVAVQTKFGLALTFAPGIYTYGAYYTGLTRDDVMGLRYLLSTNLINWETVAPGGVITVSTTNLNNEVAFPVNPASPVVENGINYGTFDLGALLSSARTNPPATLVTLFPGVVVASSSSQLVLVTNQTVVSYFTNFPGSEVGSPPVLIVATNYSVGFTTIFTDTFANVITNHYYPSTTYRIQTITVGPVKGGQAGSPSITNITYQTVVVTNMPSGDYYLVPTNQCGFDIVSTLLTNVFSVTNTLTSSTTNFVTSTNSRALGFTQNQVVTLTNVIFATHPVTCTLTPNATGLYQGIEKINFVYSSFDSLVGQFFQPITNVYTMLSVTNSQVHPQAITRVVTTPDVLFSATDLDNNNPFGIFTFFRTLSFDTANVLPGLAGPGTITLPTTISFNKAGPTYFNTLGDILIGDPALTEAPGGYTASGLYDFYLVWGSFDGSTNLPVAYPNTTSINQIENQILIQVTPSTLPNGTNGVAYAPQ
ncbi:MAG TPA: hypothetical protein VNX46_04380, partial [Candidatus Acidoferrum sp.]|nr:hypothetical protein [Candidatus Acidoferrum sp.]